jgi:putative modified peptide
MTFNHSEQTVEKSFLIAEEQANPAFQLSEAIIHSLLDKLCSDEDFRSLFQRSPREALASLGHQAAANASDSDKGIWACLRCEELASADTIKQSRDALRMQLQSENARFNPISLQVAR